MFGIIYLVYLPFAISRGLERLGTVWPDGELPINNSITNKGLVADYTFTFYTDTRVPSLGTFIIQFPEQYDIGLNPDSSFSCSLGECSISQRKITITLNNAIEADTTTELIIYGLTNPSKVGGTGPFIIYTYNGNNLLDQNRVFGVLGIEDGVGTLTSTSVAIQSGASTKAGDISKYEFRLRSPRTILAWNWIKLTFPSDPFTFAKYPNCVSFSIEGNFIHGELKCERIGDYVIVTGISQDVPAYTEVGVRVTVINPSRSGTTGFFTIDTGRNSTNTIYDRKAAIQGVYIDPGRISNIVFEPKYENTLLTRKKIVIYRLSFLLTNALEKGGSIKLFFNSNFNMDSSTYSLVEYGLDDISFTDTVTFSYNSSTKIMTISNFNTFSPKEISILMQIENPSEEGQTIPIILRTYNSDGVTIVDEDDLNIYVNILQNTSPTSITVQYPHANQNQATGSTSNLRFLMFPQVEIPERGYIEVFIYDGFQLITPVCYCQPVNVGIDICLSCDYLDGMITFQLFVSTVNVPAGSGKFLRTVQSWIQIDNIYTPLESGMYVFNINTYSENYDFLESGTAYAYMIASNFSAFNCFAYHAAVSTPTIIDIQFTTSKVVPDGSLKGNTIDKQGKIDIELNTMDNLGNLLFELDLGLGLNQGDEVPCIALQGIQPVSSKILCQLSTKPSAAANNRPVIITISEFQSIQIGNIQIHISGLKYVQTTQAPIIKVTTYYNYNRERIELETGSMSLNVGVAAPAPNTLATTITLSETEVSSNSSLSHLGTFTTAAATGGNDQYLNFHITPTHDAGFCPSLNANCSIDGASYTCWCHPGSDMILVDLGFNLAAGTHTFAISGLFNPESVPKLPNMLNLQVIGNFAVTDLIYFSNPVPTLTPGQFDNPIIQTTLRGLNYVNVRYDIDFKPEHYIPQGGVILIYFPNAYQFHRSSPQPKCQVNQLKGVADTGVVCFMYENLITVSSFQEVPANTYIQLILTGIKNPSSGTSTGPFIIRTENAARRIMDQNTQVGGFDYDTPWETLDIEDLQIIQYPSNESLIAEYTFTFNSVSRLGAGGFIYVIFPGTHFGDLNSATYCRVTNALIYYEKCQFLGNTLKITTATDYTTGAITVSLQNLINFSSGVSGDFIVRTEYDGVILQQTIPGFKAVTTDKPEVMRVDQLIYYPRNEGEVALYQFSVTPQLDIATDTNLTIVFPQVYDHRIGDDLQCWTTGLEGYVKCSIDNPWTVKVIDHNKFVACATCQISIYIYGVINPVRVYQQSTGQFRIGSLKDRHLIEFTNQAGSLEISKAGGYTDITQTTVGNNYSRFENVFTFDILTTKSIPSTSDGGEIWIQFSLDYLLEEAEVICSSDSSWANGAPDCERWFDRVKLSGQTAYYSGELQIIVERIPNPFTEKRAGFVTVEIYDDSSQTVVERSYPNLNPNRKTYVYPGPVIDVNNNEAFQVERGTISPEIPITLDFPCALNMTLYPQTTDFTFIPVGIELFSGMVNTSFRVAVPFNLEDKQYIINWTMEGELEPPYYTPIYKSLFNVVSNKDIQVIIEDITTVPLGGASIPIKVTLQAAPHNNLFLYYHTVIPDSTITFDPEFILFKDGSTEELFQIKVDKLSTTTLGQVQFSLDGTNKDTYILPRDLLDFQISSGDGEPPQVTEVKLTDVAKTYATFSVFASKVSWVYYATGLRGTTPPTFEAAKFQHPPLYSVNLIQYGYFRAIDPLDILFTMENLIAGNYYTLYVWLEDPNGIPSEEAYEYYFQTDVIYRAAIAQLPFTQTYISQTEKDLIKAQISLLLSLEDWRIWYKEVDTSTEILDTTSPNDRGLEILDTIESMLELYIIDDPKSNVYPRPVDLVDILNDKKSNLKAMVASFDDSKEIKGVEVHQTECSFTLLPEALNFSDHTRVGFTAELQNTGYIYGVAVPESQDSGRPFSKQIANGTDSKNVPVQFKQQKVSGKEKFDIIFEQLQADTIYNVYIICGNDYPGFVDLQSDDDVSVISWRTAKQPDPEEIQLSVGSILQLSLVLVLI